MKRTGSRRATVFSAAMLFVVVAGAITASIFSFPGRPARVVKAEPKPLTSGELRMVLGRVGLHAESMAAAGVSASNTTAAVEAIRGYLLDHIESLRTADAAFLTAQADLKTLDQLIRSGRASTEQAAGRAAKATALMSATAAREAVFAAIIASAGNALTQGQREMLALIRTNRHREVDLKYRAGNFSNSQWVALRDALSEQRRTQATGDSMPEAATAALSTPNADTAVVTAATNLESNLGTVTAAWEAAAIVQPH